MQNVDIYDKLNLLGGQTIQHMSNNGMTIATKWRMIRMTWMKLDMIFRQLYRTTHNKMTQQK